MEEGLISWLISWAAWFSPFIFLCWILRSEDPNKRKSPYSNPGWHFPLKRLWAYITISRVKAQRAERIAKIRASQPKHHLPPSHYEEEIEQPRQLAKQDHIDSMLLWAGDFEGNALIVRLTRMRHCQARVAIRLTLNDGQVYQLPQSPDTFVSTTSRGWSAGGLQLEVIEPLSKWRVVFNGLLRKDQRKEWSEVSVEQLHHVRFNFMSWHFQKQFMLLRYLQPFSSYKWSACSAAYNCRYDWSTSLLADTLAREPWRSGDWMDTIKSHVGGYDQWGTMLGQVNGLSGSEGKLTLHLRGLRQRRWGSNEAGRLHRRLALSGVLRTGAMFSIGADCEPGALSHATYGHVRSPDGHLYPIDWTSLSLPHLAEKPDDIPRQFVLRFKAGKHKYSAAFYLPGGGCLLYVGRPWNYQMMLEPMECALDTKQGIGLAELCYRYNGPCPLGRPPNVQFVREPAIHSSQQLTLSFSERECLSSAIVGGKGASLAALASLRDRKFRVPAGFCLTVESLKRQLRENPSLTTAIDKVNAVATARLPGNLDQVCTDAVKLFEKTPVCEDVCNEIKSALKEREHCRWAVRSSAVGEDSEELSAAGQNATILGCRDAEGVLGAVARCWASLYTYQSVSYRRQNGQQIVAEMGVVVQQMVQADTAGVLFTCDPTNGDPRRILITSNYGLGESVVSASVEPDTITVRPGNPFEITEKHCGDKGHKIVMNDKGTTEMQLGDEASRLSLEDEQAIILAQIGKQLEINFGGPRDIEWAFAEGNLYLLQSRPITSLFPWTDFELCHERDAPLITDGEVLTRANTGEVCPGASPTLVSSSIMQILDYQCAVGYRQSLPFHFSTYIVINHNQVFINVINTFLKKNTGKIETAHIANDIALFGHRALNDDLLKAGIERFGSVRPLQSGLLFLRMVKTAWDAQARADAAENLSRNFRLRYENILNAEAMLKYIVDSMTVLFESAAAHYSMSSVSSFGQVMLMTTLAEGKNDVLPEHCADMAVLMKLAATGTVSSEVPEFVTAISTELLKHEDFEQFCNSPPKDALTWLEKNLPEEYEKFQEFLVKHGHRVLREIDWRTITYDMDCLPLIEIIQAVIKTRSKGNETPLRTVNNTQKERAPKEVIGTLKSPQKTLTRLALRLLLPWYQNAVKRRELSKASFMRVMHEFRLAFRHLGKLLVQDGILPDVDLLYFLSLWELGQIIKTRNPNLLKKAIRRQRLYPQWDSYQFPELNYGLPKPLQEEDEEPIGDGVSLKATSACPGIIKAKAFVVRRNEGADKLKSANPGDILITHSTDIGWSPYFPMLGGVITELGGLISHGAVVAREYGLPCIIGAQNATRIFQTGDVIILNGDTGEVRKVEAIPNGSKDQTT